MAGQWALVGRWLQVSRVRLAWSATYGSDQVQAGNRGVVTVQAGVLYDKKSQGKAEGRDV